ncbi:MAG: hypothetical protein LBH39_03530 [Clostridiales Family XIII bacterium]|jgi:hypothetical protein|nr:hypothetical protein [Clostridiales Family XIII bacterium]
MGLLRDISSKYKTVSVIGMAKNAGKTTTLNYLIAEAEDEGMRLGISSTGRDGETADVVTGTEKPKVYVPEDAIVTIPSKLYELSEAGLEILCETGHSTSMGQVMLCRAAECGYVQIAGPVSTSGQKEVCAEMLAWGADMVLIDGAIDRRAIAAPAASDAVILATGAALSRSMSKVAEETACVAELYGLPEIGEAWIRDVILKEENAGKIIFFKDGAATVSALKTGLAAGRALAGQIGKGESYIYIPGALTGGVIAGIPQEALKNTGIIVADPTRIFLGAAEWMRLKKKGLRIFLMSGVKIAAITVNPWSPEGYSFDSGALAGSIGAYVGGIPVIDIRKGRTE